MVMNWAYIAGFFDGEGNIRLDQGRNNGVGAVHMAIAQAGDRGLTVLTEISEFMRGFGIRSKVGKRKEFTTGRKRQRVYRLYSQDRRSIRLFIEHTMPFLRIKKVESQDLLRYIELFPISRGGILWKRSNTHPAVKRWL